MKAWPFLISSSVYTDYRTVVMPDFIADANAEKEIVRASDGSFRTGDGEAIYLRGYREGVGPINIVLRSRLATSHMLGKEDGSLLHDNVGRNIRIFEGIVMREEGSGSFTNAQLDVALSQSKPHFSRFWEDTKGGDWKAVPMPAFDLPAAEGKALSLD